MTGFMSEIHILKAILEGGLEIQEDCAGKVEKSIVP